MMFKAVVSIVVLVHRVTYYFVLREATYISLLVSQMVKVIYQCICHFEECT